MCFDQEVTRTLVISCCCLLQSDPCSIILTQSSFHSDKNTLKLKPTGCGWFWKLTWSQFLSPSCRWLHSLRSFHFLCSSHWFFSSDNWFSDQTISLLINDLQPPSCRGLLPFHIFLHHILSSFSGWWSWTWPWEENGSPPLTSTKFGFKMSQWIRLQLFVVLLLVSVLEQLCSALMKMGLRTNEDQRRFWAFSGQSDANVVTVGWKNERKKTTKVFCFFSAPLSSDGCQLFVITLLLVRLFTNICSCLCFHQFSTKIDF